MSRSPGVKHDGGRGWPFGPLPAPLTSFVGREREQAALADLLLGDEVRLVTVLGPGGVGKTRLALRVAQAIGDRFRDGALFVPLAGLGAADQVASTLARELRVLQVAERSMPELLADALREREILVVLDNVEHVRDAAPLFSHLLAAAPELTILATSRVVLRVSGEHVVPLPPLSLPTVKGSRTAAAISEAEAVRLFVTRATAARPDFALTDDNGLHVAGICRRLDGLPLALELAAARVSVLPPAALAEHLESSLALLTGGARDQPARLHSMTNAIAWSYELLDAEQQRLFRQLSVFAGGFTLDSLSAISYQPSPPPPPERSDTPSTLDTLTALVEASLVLPDPSAAEMPRYTMLETLRQFGQERLVAHGEEATVRDRHAAWCLDLVETAWPPRAAAPVSLAALARIDAEVDNVRAALTWHIGQGEVESALRLTGDLAEYWCLRGDFAEGQVWLERALALPDGTPTTRAAAFYGAAITAWFQGKFAVARVFGERSQELSLVHGDLLDVVRARFIIGQIMAYQEHIQQIVDYTRSTVELARKQPDRSWLGYPLVTYGSVLQAASDLPAAMAAFQESSALFRAADDLWGEMNSLEGVAAVLTDLGLELDRAAALYAEVAAISQRLGNPWGLPEVALGLANIALRLDRFDIAAFLLGVAESLAQPIGLSLDYFPRQQWRRALDATRDRLDDATFLAAHGRGRAVATDATLETLRAVAAELAAVSRQHGSAGEASSLLTPREREVLALIARGLSNRQIADDLFISRGTARTHVANILAKLEIHSRADAATAAERLGIAAMPPSTYGT